jgi:succinate-acetate transporter protein
MIMVLAFVVPLEIIAGLLAFPARDVGAATGLSLLGAAWAATALALLGGPPGARSAALAIFLLMMAAIMLVLAGASLSAKPAFGLLLLIGACRFALTGIYQGSLGGGSVTATVAGWIGLPLAAFSLYGGLALLLEDGAQHTVLPIGRRGRARSSLEGGITHQIDAAEREAGVRRQL